MSTDRMTQGITEADHARAELYDTLSQLRGRLDYARRIDDAAARAKRRISAEKRDNPLLFAAGAAGVAVAGGLAVWAIASKVIRAFK